MRSERFLNGWASSRGELWPPWQSRNWHRVCGFWIASGLKPLGRNGAGSPLGLGFSFIQQGRPSGPVVELATIPDPAEQFPSLRAKRSNPGAKNANVYNALPWIATALKRLATTNASSGFGM